MNRRLLASLSVLVLSLPLCAQGSFWSRQVPAPSTRWHDVHVLSAFDAWIAGSGGRLRHTTTGGLSWIDVQVPSLEVRAVAFRDPQTGWRPRVSAGRHTGRRDVTDEDGSFAIAGLPAGLYRLDARSKKEASAPSEPVVVESGATATVELRVAPATVLELSLQDGEGTLLPALWSVLDIHGCNHAGTLGAADPMDVLLVHGPRLREPHLGPLAPGSYRIEALAPDGRKVRGEIVLAGERSRRLELVLPAR